MLAGKENVSTAAKETLKAAKKAEYEAASYQGNQGEDGDGAADCSVGRYGPLGLIKSKGKFEQRKFVPVHQLSQQLFVVSQAKEQLPLQIEDASRPDNAEELESGVGIEYNDTLYGVICESMQFTQDIYERMLECGMDIESLYLIKEDDINELFPLSMLGTRIKFKERLSQWRQNEARTISSLESCISPLNNTQDAQNFRFLKSLERENIFKQPISYIINEEISEIVVNNNPGLHSNKIVGVLMPIKFQIQKYFETNNNLKSTLNNMDVLQSDQEIYSNVIHGETWKQKVSGFREKLVIPYILYFDDFGVGNPLGSSAPNQSICGIYYNFPTIPKHHLSTLENIFVAGFFKSRHRKDYGNSYSFEPLIKVIQQLETEGLILTTAEGEFKIFFVLSLIIGDNLGLNSILGFTTSFNSNYYCRCCKRHKTEMQSDIIEYTDSLRTSQSYSSDCAIRNDKLTGIKETCVFHQIPTFHTLDNFYFDLMHDVFEGVCRYDISEILLNFIESKKYLSLETLNYRKQMFPYGVTEIGNNSPPINLVNLKCSSFKMSAREMMCFVHHLPLIIGDLIPEGDEVWDFFLILLQIIDILMMSKIDESTLNSLKSLIERHHYQYKLLFRKPLKPKFHFLVHYISSIKKCGPLKNIWCMRFEAVHKIFKTYANSITSRINIPWSLSIKAALKFTYNLTNETFFLPDLYLNVTVLLPSSTRFKYSSDFQKTHNIIKYNFYSEVTYKGLTFKKGFCFNINEDAISFFEIEDIVVSSSSELFFISSQHKIISFNSHTQSYIVDEKSSEYHFINGSKVCSPPLHMHTIQNIKLIRLKRI